MGVRLNYSEKNDDNIALFFDDIKGACEEAEKKVLEKMRIQGKRIVIAELKKIKRTSKINAKRIKHMCEDVNSTVKKDQFGYKSLKIKGGKKTGTLWHIVNDGTYRSKGHRFIDKAIEKIDDEFEKACDDAMKGIF